MRKYLKAMRCAFIFHSKDRRQLVGRLMLFTIVVYLFHQIFQSVNAPATRLWYYAMTEAIILATTPLVLQIAEDIRTNKIIYFLLYPLNYCRFRLFEAMGASLFRYMILILWALLYVPLLQGTIEVSKLQFTLSLFIGVLGIFLYSILSLLIGLCSFWLKEVKTLLYFNLTATFCLGGLIVPITYYPYWMQIICFLSPYPWILWWPASLYSGTFINPIYALLGWGTWTLAALFIGYLLFRRYQRRLVMEGG